MSLGNLNVKIGSSVSGLVAGAAQAKSTLGSLRGSINEGAAALGRYGKIAVSVGGALAGWKLLKTAREFDVLNAQLRTATGSMQGAGLASEAIRDFAATTPYDLQQVTTAFTKLVNLGLTPSERALTSYGNTASAMGKDLDQMIEAVADAATGEFERLKEFGIKASAQGDQVSFRFRGMTTTVANSAEAIEGYLAGLGENEFAGAMAERMNSLDGELSNLEDSWTNLFQTINEAGVTTLMRDGVALASEAIQFLTDMIASGALQAGVDALISKFDQFGESAAMTMDFLRQNFGETASHWASVGGEVMNFLGDAFMNLPENMHAAISLVAVELGALIDHARNIGTAFGEVLGVRIGMFVEKAKVYGAAIGDALNPFEDSGLDMDKELARLESLAGEMTDSYIKMAETRVNESLEARRQSIMSIIEERDVALASFDAQVDGAKSMFEEFRRLRDERDAQDKGDRLAQFRVGGSAAEGGADDPSGDKAFQKRIDQLLSQYETEDQLLLERQEKVAELNRAFEWGEIESRAQFEAIRQQIIQESEDKILAIKQKSMTALEKFQSMSFKNQTKMILGELVNLTAGVAQHSRTMFEINKAAGIANAIVNAYEGISLTLKSYPYPINVGLAALHGAAAFAQVSAIRSASFAGGGGGSAPSIAGSTPATPVSNVSSGGGGGATGGLFTLTGFDPNRNYEGEEMRDLFAKIQEHVNNGGRINLLDGA